MLLRPLAALWLIASTECLAFECLAGRRASFAARVSSCRLPPTSMRPRATSVRRSVVTRATSVGVESAQLPTLIKFLRPHTVRGTILASVTGVARAISEQPGGLMALWQWALLPRAVAGMIALICGNVYIVGINQIYDVEIDKVNKPFLPIAAGEMSELKAWIAVLLCASVGTSLVWRLFSPIIFKLYVFGLTIGYIRCFFARPTPSSARTLIHACVVSQELVLDPPVPVQTNSNHGW